MKKSLIALALLGLSGTVAAQSSVTLYGRIDTGIGSIKINDPAATNGTAVGTKAQTEMYSGNRAGLTGPRWGLRGTEDLGNGLSAYFQIESRFNSDDGSQAAASGVTTGFGAQSIVGLRGSFGFVQLGRDYTAYDAFSGAMQAVNAFDAGHNPRGNVFALGGDYAVRGSNQIMYGGAFGPVNVRLSHSFDEEAGNNNIGSGSIWYGAGPLVVGLAMQSAANGDDYTLLGATYDFGVARVGATIGRVDDITPNNDQDEYTLGVAIPLGAFSVSAAYASAEADNGAERDGWGIVGRYSLSNRTTLYTGYQSTNGEDAAGVRDFETRIFSVGVRHDF